MQFWENALFLIAQSGAGADKPPGLSFSDMLPWLLGLFALFYFFVLRPQKKQESQRKAMLNAITKGDSVQTAGGILGVVIGVDEPNDVVVVEVDKNCKMRFTRSSISAVQQKGKKGVAPDKAGR